MARERTDEATVGVLALGALVLGLVALVLVFRVSDRAPGESEASSSEPNGWSWLAPRHVDSPDGGVPYNGYSASSSAWSTGLLGSGNFVDEEDDPQVLAMRRSFGDDAGMAASFSPYRHAGHATFASGLNGVSSASSCDVRVLPVRSEGGFNCVVRVRCDGVTVYPDGALEAGYAPCDVEHGVPRTATDRGTTDRDGDPELYVDLDARLVRVRDLRSARESVVEIRLD